MENDDLAIAGLRFGIRADNEGIFRSYFLAGRASATGREIERLMNACAV